jgi:hypothetical protein
MKTDDASRKHAERAPRVRFADFLFVGLGVVPLVLLLGGLPGIALLVFIPLMFAACLCGMWEQVGSGPGPSAGSGDKGGQLGGKPPAAGISLRQKL